MATIRKIGGKSGEAYQLDYYDQNGKRVRKRLYVNRKTAERIRKEVEIRIERIKLGIEKTSIDSPYLKLFIPEYLKYKEGIVSYATVKRDQFALKRFLKFSGDERLSQITSKQMDDYAVQMRADLKEATIGIELRHLKAAFNIAKRWEYIVKNPLEGIKIPDGVPKQIRVLSREEISRLFSIIDNPEMRDIINAYLATGARRSELLRPKFSWDNIDFKNNRIHFDGKGNKLRYVPMTPAISKILAERLT